MTTTHILGRIPLDEGSGRSRGLYSYNTQHLQETNIDVPGGIPTRNPSKRAAARLTPQAMPCVPATSVHARFPPTHLSGQTHVCKWGCSASTRVASERAKRTLWLVAATKLVCPLLPCRSCGRLR
jgi:hypothetical protein